MIVLMGTWLCGGLGGEARRVKLKIQDTEADVEQASS